MFTPENLRSDTAKRISTDNATTQEKQSADNSGNNVSI